MIWDVEVEVELFLEESSTDMKRSVDGYRQVHIVNLARKRARLPVKALKVEITLERFPS